MTDKEKIKAEIERRIKELQPCNTSENLRAHGAIAGYYQILSFINSLQKEPVSEDLEEPTQTITYKGEVYTRCYKDKLDAFACKYPMSVPKTSKKYAKYSDVDLTIAVKEGAKWQKEQMMTNAADAVIGLPYENKDGGYTHLVDVSRPLPVGKNKIAIIFKED